MEKKTREILNEKDDILSTVHVATTRGIYCLTTVIGSVKSWKKCTSLKITTETINLKIIQSSTELHQGHLLHQNTFFVSILQTSYHKQLHCRQAKYLKHQFQEPTYLNKQVCSK